jgi:hypothetical protein
MVASDNSSNEFREDFGREELSVCKVCQLCDRVALSDKSLSQRVFFPSLLHFRNPLLQLACVYFF